MTYTGHPFEITVHPRLLERSDVGLHELMRAANEAAKTIWEEDKNPRRDKDYQFTIASSGPSIWLSAKFMDTDVEGSKTIFHVKQARKVRH